jgi:hypothetical protein
MFEAQYNDEMETEVKRLEAQQRAVAAGHPEWVNACADCGCELKRPISTGATGANREGKERGKRELKRESPRQSGLLCMLVSEKSGLSPCMSALYWRLFLNDRQ